jgi:hypothetical protein
VGYKKRVVKSETYCFRMAQDEREMVKFLQKSIDVPFELRKKVREMYNSEMKAKIEPPAPEPEKKYDPDASYFKDRLGRHQG